MEYPPLQPLHTTASLSQVKLKLYARLPPDELKSSLEPNQSGSLKVVQMERSLTVIIGLKSYAQGELT